MHSLYYSTNYTKRKTLVSGGQRGFFFVDVDDFIFVLLSPISPLTASRIG